MEVLGLPGRERDYVLDVSVSLDVRVRLSATSSEAASSELTHRDIAEAIRVLDGGELVSAITDHSVDDVESD